MEGDVGGCGRGRNGVRWPAGARQMGGAGSDSWRTGFGRTGVGPPSWAKFGFEHGLGCFVCDFQSVLCQINDNDNGAAFGGALRPLPRPDELFGKRQLFVCKNVLPQHEEWAQTTAPIMKKL